MQPIRFCSTAGCFNVAIKTKRSDDRCRQCYREQVLASATDLVTCEVLASTGSRGEQAGVTDAVTNATVRHGGMVVLDPLETNIAALVAGGTVRVVASPAAESLKV